MPGVAATPAASARPPRGVAATLSTKIAAPRARSVDSSRPASAAVFHSRSQTTAPTPANSAQAPSRASGARQSATDAA